MDSRLISKLDKARRYADEPGRVTMRDVSVTFQGDNATHEVAYQGGVWHCSCGEFARTGDCAHVLAVKYRMARALDNTNIDHDAHLLTSI